MKENSITISSSYQLSPEFWRNFIDLAYESFYETYSETYYSNKSWSALNLQESEDFINGLLKEYKATVDYTNQILTFKTEKDKTYFLLKWG
jgi:hypothetical protein